MDVFDHGGHATGKHAHKYYNGVHNTHVRVHLNRNLITIMVMKRSQRLYRIKTLNIS